MPRGRQHLLPRAALEKHSIGRAAHQEMPTGRGSAGRRCDSLGCAKPAGDAEIEHMDTSGSHGFRSIRTPRILLQDPPRESFLFPKAAEPPLPFDRSVRCVTSARPCKKYPSAPGLSIWHGVSRIRDRVPGHARHGAGPSSCIPQSCSGAARPSVSKRLSQRLSNRNLFGTPPAYLCFEAPAERAERECSSPFQHPSLRRSERSHG